MLSRRALMASTAALAVGCGSFRSAAELTWYTFWFTGLRDRSDYFSPQMTLPKIVAALE